MHRAPLLPALFLLAACTGELADLDSRDGAALVVGDGGAPRSGDGGTPAVDGSTPAPDDGGIPVPEGWTCPAVEVFSGVADEVTYGPHPRVLMAAADLPAVRARWAADPFGTRARFEGSSNAIDVAFRVLMDDDGDEDLEPVVAELVRRVNAMSRYAKDPDSPIFESAATLDLAWDYLSAGQRERLADAIVAKVRSVSVLDSPTEDTLSNHRMEHVVTGHAIAAFTLRGTDDRLYDHDGFGEWFWERLLPDNRAWVESGIHHQGTIYFGLRAVTLVMLDTFTHSLTGRWAFPGCGRRIAFTPLLGGTPHMNALRWGDASTLGVGGDSTQQALVLAGAAWGDPHVLAMADSGSFEGYSSYAASPVARLWEMIFRDAAIVPDEDYEALGTAWPIPGPIGPGYSHRSSNGVYGSDDVPVPVYFTMSGERFVGGHQHAAVGQSTFWYRGVLWGDSGSYTGAGPSKIFSDYWWDQVYGSTSKSGVPLVYDRSVDYGRDIANSGQQRIPERDRATTFANAPTFADPAASRLFTSAAASYMESDITPAYHESQVDSVRILSASLLDETAARPMVVFEVKRIAPGDPSFPRAVPYFLGGSPAVSGHRVVADAAVTDRFDGGGRVVMEAFGDIAEVRHTAAHRSGWDASGRDWSDERPQHASFPHLDRRVSFELERDQASSLFVLAAAAADAEGDLPAATYAEQETGAYVAMAERSLAFAPDFTRRSEVRFEHRGGRCLVVHLEAGRYEVEGGAVVRDDVAGSGALLLEGAAGTVVVRRVE